MKQLIRNYKNQFSKGWWNLEWFLEWYGHRQFPCNRTVERRNGIARSIVSVTGMAGQPCQGQPVILVDCEVQKWRMLFAWVGSTFFVYLSTYDNELETYWLWEPSYSSVWPIWSQLQWTRTEEVSQCLQKLYFPLSVMLVQHKQALHPRIRIAEASRCRPVRKAARQQRALMAITAAGIANSTGSINHFMNNFTCFIGYV